MLGRHCVARVPKALRWAALPTCSLLAFPFARVSVSVRRRVATGVVIWKRTFNSHKGKQNPVVQLLKQADLEMLELSAAGTRNRFKIDTASLRENVIIP